MRFERPSRCFDDSSGATHERRANVAILPPAQRNGARYLPGVQFQGDLRMPFENQTLVRK